MLKDLSNVEVAQIQVSHDGNRIWVNVDGKCVLRVTGIKVIEIQDDREEKSRSSGSTKHSRENADHSLYDLIDDDFGPSVFQ